MREILFKAKRLDNGEWVEGNLITNERNENQKYIGYIFDERNGVIEDFDLVEVIPETICQYTGLTDKAGRKIWENDIVVEKYKGRIAVKYRIVFDLEEGSWMLETRSGARYGIGSINQKDFDVIGNIFDNEEMLDVERC